MRPAVALAAIALAAILLSALLSPGPARADPVVTDATAAKRILGRHAITLQWIGSGTLTDAGIAEVKPLDGEWRLNGRQDAKEGYVALDGIVTKVEKSSFTFQGKVVTKVDYNFAGKECAREGEFVFLMKSGRKYWRMQPIENPCDQVADYIDIYR